MARKTSANTKEFNLLFPSLVLSIVALLLVVAVSSMPQKKQTVIVEASQESILSKSDDVNSLENDLILLQSDNLLEEESVINSIE